MRPDGRFWTIWTMAFMKIPYLRYMDIFGQRALGTVRTSGRATPITGQLTTGPVAVASHH